MTRRSINVHAEKVPNPDAMKFTIEGILLTHGGFEYNSQEEAEESPLATKLFGFDYVERVFISKNFVTVTKKAGEEVWEGLMIDVRIVVKKHLEAGEPLFNFEDPGAPVDEAGDDLANRIRRVLDQQVRPATWQDGGDLWFESIEEGVVKVGMAGACIRCPFAPRTLKAGVEVILKRQFPEVVSVTSDTVNWEETEKEVSPGFD